MSDDLDTLDRMIAEADEHDGDTDLETDPDLEDAEGQDYVDHDGTTRFPAYVLRAVPEWQWNPECEPDTSAEQWGEPEWVGDPA